MERDEKEKDKDEEEEDKTSDLEVSPPASIHEEEMEEEVLEVPADLHEEGWMNSLQSLKAKPVKKSMGSESTEPLQEEKPVLTRAISLKDRLAGLAKQAEEDDQSYEKYIKDAEKDGKKIIETGKKLDEEKPFKLEEEKPFKFEPVRPKLEVKIRAEPPKVVSDTGCCYVSFLVLV